MSKLPKFCLFIHSFSRYIPHSLVVQIVLSTLSSEHPVYTLFVAAIRITSTQIRALARDSEHCTITSSRGIVLYNHEAAANLLLHFIHKYCSSNS